MDPFSGESELFNILTAFHQYQYHEVLNFDTSAFSAANKTSASILKYRAQIALGDTTTAPPSDIPEPDISALKALASSSSSSSSSSSALSTAESLASTHPENPTVQLCISTILAQHSRHDEALSLLSRHQGNLEAVALTIQIQLQQNRTDLALKEVQKAKSWAQDNLLSNLAEAWVGLRLGGADKYQATFYVYEELASAASSSSPTALIGQAVSEIHLGRLPEAEAALQQVLGGEQKVSPAEEVQGVADSVVLAALQGKGGTEEMEGLVQRLKGLEGGAGHPLLTDWAEKERLFDEAKTKYAPKVGAS